MLKALSLIIFSFSSYADLPPPQYEKNSYTVEKSSVVGRRRFFTYGIKDHVGAYRELKWNINALDPESFMHIFGLKPKYTENFDATETEIKYSMMINKNGNLYFDYSKIVEESRPLIKPLYLEFKKIFKKYDLSTREKIELVMRFLQDIPYGIPPANYKGKYIGELFPPIELLISTWGDCDSKSLLMATILSFEREFYDKMAVIDVPGHALLGFRLTLGPYDKFVHYNGMPYIYAEPVGLSRTPLGMTNSPYSRAVEVRPLILMSPPDGKYQKHGPTRYFSKAGELLREENYSRGERL